MEQVQIADKPETTAPLGKPSTTDLFVFRPLVAPPPPPHAQRPSSKRGGIPPFLLRFRPAPPPPVRAAPSNPSETLRGPDEERFHRLLDQYRAFRTDGTDPAACLHFDLQAISTIYDLTAKSERNAPAYADLHQLELAVLRVMPEAVLRGEVHGRRARYRAVVSPAQYRQHMRSKPTPKDDAAGPVEALRAEMAFLLAQTQHHRPGASSGTDAHTAVWQVSACWAFGLCVMGALGFVLIHLSPVPAGVAPAVPLVMALTGGVAAALAYIRREHP